MRLLALCLILASFAASAAEPASPCRDAIQGAERQARLPAGLLGAIGMVESGRTDPATGRADSWPWTINVAGTGAFFATKADAIAAVQAAWRAGTRSIDVGCMQVNLLHHPAAFASLEDAFDPNLNATYAAGFLTRLFAQTGGWGSAAAAYHSQDAERGAAYRQRVAAIWPAAGGGPFVPARRQAARIDPLGIYTPEFRATLAQNAADRAARVAMGLIRPAGASRALASRSAGVLHASLGR